MAIAAANASYRTLGPAKSGQILAANTMSNTEVAYLGTATFTLDGTSTSATLNFIDGTQTVQNIVGDNAGVNMAGVMAVVVGGTQTGYVGVSTNSVSSTGCTVNFSTAGSNANTVIVAFFIIK